jgi:pyruvate dehydrogenase E2 component (dihydrolipoamide acetyltransferase)
MATKVHMEALSPTMEEGQIIQWLKSEGDEVKNGDVLAEIETDKATMELVARGDGVLRKILKAEGATAPVGEVIAVIAAADEDISAIAGDDAAAEAGEPPEDEETAWWRGRGPKGRPRPRRQLGRRPRMRGPLRLPPKRMGG